MQASYEQILQTIIRGVVYTYKFPMQTTRQHCKSNAFEIPESLLTITQMVRVHISSMVKGFFVPGNSVVCFESIYKWISWVLIGKVASRPGCAMIFYTKPVCLQKLHRTFLSFLFFFCIRRLSKRLSVCVFLLVYRDNLKAFDDIFFSRCRDKPCQLHLFYHSWHCDI